METITKIIIGLLIIGLGIQLSLNQEQVPGKPGWVKDVRWQDNKPSDSARIEELLWTKISPYTVEYEFVNISSSNKGGLRVIAEIKDSENPDIYDFVYENNELQLTGYLLEAIPQMYRDEAIGIALGDKEVAPSVTGSPTVRRILPETSEKFYAPKTMFSVTWKGISALVDLDERKVAKVWKTGTQPVEG